MRISLVGLPGVGKSTVGRRLAKRLGLTFVDCDELVEQQLGEPIAGFFERRGEPAFRDVEELVLADAASRHDVVIATGGGVVLRDENRRVLRQRTLCVYLEAAPQSLLEGLRRNDRRPLLRVADPEARLLELSTQRDPLYREVADLVVATGRNVATTLAEVEAALLRLVNEPGPGAQAAPCR